MTRPIKFRAWQKTHKYMTTDISMSTSYDEQRFYYTQADDGIAIDEDWVLMQFTGLRDKDGKDIYEGDIIADAYGSWEVFFNNSAFGLKIKKSPKARQYILGIKSRVECGAKVVGNIYENPELLK